MTVTSVLSYSMVRTDLGTPFRSKLTAMACGRPPISASLHAQRVLTLTHWLARHTAAMQHRTPRAWHCGSATADPKMPKVARYADIRGEPGMDLRACPPAPPGPELDSAPLRSSQRQCGPRPHWRRRSGRVPSPRPRLGSPPLREWLWTIHWSAACQLTLLSPGEPVRVPPSQPSGEGLAWHWV